MSQYQTHLNLLLLALSSPSLKPPIPPKRSINLISLSIEITSTRHRFLPSCIRTCATHSSSWSLPAVRLSLYMAMRSSQAVLQMNVIIFTVSFCVTDVCEDRPDRLSILLCEVCRTAVRLNSVEHLREIVRYFWTLDYVLLTKIVAFSIGEYADLECQTQNKHYPNYYRTVLFLHLISPVGALGVILHPSRRSFPAVP